MDHSMTYTNEETFRNISNRIQLGLCPNCLAQCYNIDKGGVLTPLDIEGKVQMGVCLKCVPKHLEPSIKLGSMKEMDQCDFQNDKKAEFEKGDSNNDIIIDGNKRIAASSNKNDEGLDT